MSSAASAAASIAARSGACGTNAGAMPKRRAQRIRVSTADVRDDVSSAIDRTSRIGLRVNSATDATGPSDPMQTPGTMRSPGRSR